MSSLKDYFEKGITRARWLGLVVVLLGITACKSSVFNNPYSAEQDTQNILYSSFSERPKHLDPIKSYVENEYDFIGQIYEPPFQYHYLKRPYELIPLTSTAMPQVLYLDKEGNRLPEHVDVKKVAFSQFDIRIQPGIQFQPHPAFAKDKSNNYVYHNLKDNDLADVEELADFKKNGSRELVAADYIYQIKRFAHPKINSPIYGLMSKYIVGLNEYTKKLKKVYKLQLDKNPESVYLDLHQHNFAGAKVISRYHYRITIKGIYPQLKYWLAMPFFSPVPHEADKFYSQPGMKERNISFDWYPVGTGPYMLTVNDPNSKMVLEKNPNFRGMKYPNEGSKKDKALGLLVDAGQTMPFIDKAIYSLEKEGIPLWSKFLQGYYDASEVSSSSFDQAVQFSALGEAGLTSYLSDKGIQLLTETKSSISYLGFNMLDSVVGGTSERARLLRQAIAIAFDYEEFISIFLNGRGISAQSPIPPGIFGYQPGEVGINPYVYKWEKGELVRKDIAEAKRLLKKAGYENGIDKNTNKPLTVYFDTTASGAGAKAYLDFLRKQFKKLNIALIIRSTDFNRFQEKVRNGNAQLFRWGWNADYPDPENFLFLFYGPNGKVKGNGENTSNYDNPEFDRLFEKMETMPNTEKRLVIINKIREILNRDAPWLWGYHEQEFSLFHKWYKNVKPSLMAHNVLMYRRIDTQLRAQSREQWNKPIIWPLILFVFLLIILIYPAVKKYNEKERYSHKEGEDK